MTIRSPSPPPRSPPSSRSLTTAPATASILLFPLFGDEGSYEIQITVSDPHDATDTATLLLAVSAPTIAPPPALVASCGLVNLSYAAIHLSWDASSTPGVDAYEVFWDSPSAGGFVSLGEVPAPATNFIHSFTDPLLNLGLHRYAVRAKVSEWTSPLSPTDTVLLAQVALLLVCSDL